MKITVTGASGAQGGAVAKLLEARGHDVRRMTRRPNGPTDVHGDYDSPESLGKAFDGADGVFVVTTPFGTDTDTETETRQGIAAVDAARDVPHVVLTSATNADRSTGIPHFDSKQRIEEYLSANHPQWTIIAPAAFMDDKDGGAELVLPMPPDMPLYLIAVADIAAMAVLAFEQPDRFRGRRIDIAGDVLTGPQIATLRGGRFTQTPLEQAERYSPDLAAMFRYFHEVGLEVDVPALKAEFPEIRWHTYADWINRASRRTPA